MEEKLKREKGTMKEEEKRNNFLYIPSKQALIAFLPFHCLSRRFALFFPRRASKISVHPVDPDS